MELRGSQNSHNGVAESPETPTTPALPSKKDIILIVLFLLLVTFGFQNILGPVLSQFSYDFTRPDDDMTMTLVRNSVIAGWYLRLFDQRAALITSVLLYFGVARRGSRREQWLRRGEIFTGLVNLHIFFLAFAMPFASLYWQEVSEVYLGCILVTYLISTAFWCVVGFHLCEGRYLLPLGGLFLWHLFRTALLATWSLVPMPVFGLLLLAGPVAGLGWQIGALIRAGSGFDLFPTGLLPAVKRCARVFLLSAACFWLLSGILRLMAAGLRGFSSVAGIELWLGGVVDLTIAYLVPIFLVAWEDHQLERRSRRLAYRLLGLVTLLLLLCVPSMSLMPYGMGWHLYSLFWGVTVIIIFPLWSVLVPLSIYRWWVRDRFVRPVAIAAVGAAIFALLILFLGTEYESVGFAYGADRVITILLVVMFLFRRIPPAREISSPTVREGAPRQSGY